MKKLLLLGGSAQQVVAIETAKRLGCYTVLCDYLPDNPGQYHADKFYLVSTVDKEAVLQVARDEKIDGVVAYASDPAAPTAAYVAEELGLPGNPYESANILCNKDHFRAFLREQGLNAPEKINLHSSVDSSEVRDKLHLPVIVKPVDSSGSKGVTILSDWSALSAAYRFAIAFSRSGRVIVEEYIEKKHPYLIGGDIFVSNGKICLWGLLNCHRDPMVNPLVSVGKSFPLFLSPEDVSHVKETLQRMVEGLNYRDGAMNVELVIDSDDRVWPIDVGPRNGGNMIPDLLGMIFGVDVVEMTIRAAMGEHISFNNLHGKPYYATYNLHSRSNGVFQRVTYAPEMKQHIVKEVIYKQPGDRVECFDNASKALGIVFLRFDSMEQMLYMMDHSEEWIQVELRQ